MNDPMEFQKVGERMRRYFISAEPTDSALQGAQLMQLARIRHLPVVLDGRLLGIVSHRDLLEGSYSPLEERSAAQRLDWLRAIPLARIMHTSVCTVSPEATLREAAEQMLRHKIGCLPVVGGGAKAGQPGEIVGLITESDLLAAAYLPGIDPRTFTAEAADLPILKESA
jgi:CBS domain-containing membrane protein